MAARCNLPEPTTRHVLRAAISLRIFHEPAPDIVAHNACSHALVAVPGLMDWVGFCAEDVVPAASGWAEALERYPEAERVTQTGFSVAVGGGGVESYWDVIGRDAARERRFGRGQWLLMAHPGRDPVHFANSVEWSGERCPKAIVDIGGSNGGLTETLLKTFPGIQSAVVQDLPTVAAQAKVPEGLEDRMFFEGYNFFTPQHRRADVFIFRVILHDWPDADVVHILKNQVPVLEPGNRIMLNEILLEGPLEGKAFEDQQLRLSDVVMHEFYNSKERSQDEWTALFAAADPRFKVESFVTIPGAILSTITVKWTG